jgi:hypothetical protein
VRRNENLFVDVDGRWTEPHSAYVWRYPFILAVRYGSSLRRTRQRRLTGDRTLRLGLRRVTLAGRSRRRGGQQMAQAWEPADSESKRAELKRFLRARRAALSPEACGFQGGGRRLTPGLRREEVAATAGVGLSWYTWLEQGRDINISANAAERIARALQLNEADRAYLFWLSDLPHSPEAVAGPVSRLNFQSIVDGHRWPAFAVDAIWNLLAINAIARQLYMIEGYAAAFENNQLWQLFMNPARRALYVDYDDDVRHFVGLFRMSSAPFADEPALQALVGGLSAASPTFDRLWHEYRTENFQPRALRVRHPEWGDLTFTTNRVPLPTEKGGALIFLTPLDEATRMHWLASDDELRRSSHAMAGGASNSTR